MIDQDGYLYDEDKTGYRRIGSVLEHDLKELMKNSSFDPKKYVSRGAIYKWKE